MLELGDAYDVINDSDNYAVVSAGEVLNDSYICAMNNEDKIFIASASIDEETNDGAMFTFYVSKNSASNDVSINFVDVNDITPVSGVNPRDVIYLYGDVNHDGRINAMDASDVLGAINMDGNDGRLISVETINQNLETYFPNIINGEIADVVDDGAISEYDARDILTFYDCSMTGRNYSDYSMGKCGQVYSS
jgi:hypothetical protein